MIQAIIIFASITLAFLSLPAYAKKTVYSPKAEESELEFEYYIDWKESPDGQDLTTHELELEYGFTARDGVAFSLVYLDPSDNGLDFDKYKIEWIHELDLADSRRFDAALYLEYQIKDNNNEADVIEFKPLLERRLRNRPVTLSFNGILEKEIGGNAKTGLELGYAARIDWQVSPAVLAGIEAFGAFGEAVDIKPMEQQSHIIGPVLDLEPGHEIEWQIGALFGLTDGSEDVRLKSNLSIEW